MKAKLFGVIIAVLVLCSVASAQGYAIRADSNVNLRARPNLESDIIVTVPAGTILHVIDEFNRWLKVSRTGTEMWMADWVSYTRVESSSQPQTSSPPASSVPSNVDNCCFVDRQCHSDEEWTSGFWAFQNNQCAAPSQSPVDAAPAQAPAGNKHGMIFEGAPDWTRYVSEALNRLRVRAPEWYVYVTSVTDKFVEYWLDSEHDSSGAAYVLPPERTIYISRSAVFRVFTDSGLPLGVPPFYRTHELNIFNLAGILVHEACHLHQHEDGHIYQYPSSEVMCHLVELKALNAMKAPPDVKRTTRVVMRFHGS